MEKLESIKNSCVKDIMNRDVVCVHEDTKLEELAQLLTERKITGAPVLDSHESLVGVVSQADLLCLEVPESFRAEKCPNHFYQTTWVSGWYTGPYKVDLLKDPQHSNVGFIMSKEPITIKVDASVGQVARLMLEEKIHRVIVVDDMSRVQGIVTTMDILKVLTA